MTALFHLLLTWKEKQFVPQGHRNSSSTANLCSLIPSLIPFKMACTSIWMEEARVDRFQSFFKLLFQQQPKIVNSALFHLEAVVLW